MKDDFFSKVRNTMIANMQVSLPAIRSLMHMTEGQLGAVLGLSDTNIRRLEENQESMTEVQYVALCGILDNMMQNNEKLKEGVMRLLQIDRDEESSLVGRWLLVFDEGGLEKEEINDGQELDEEDVAFLAQNYKIFIYYDSLKLCRNNAIFDVFLKSMEKNQNRLMIPSCTLVKLQKDILSSQIKLVREARTALSVLNHLKQTKSIAIKRDERDGSVEEIVRELFCTYKNSYRMALITENERLARDLQIINREMDGFDIKVITLQGNKMKVYEAWKDASSSVITEDTSTTESMTVWHEL